MKNPNKLKVPKGHRLIFRASKKDKNGNTIYAKDYGLRGFPIVIPRWYNYPFKSLIERSIRFF